MVIAFTMEHIDLVIWSNYEIFQTRTPTWNSPKKTSELEPVIIHQTVKLKKIHANDCLEKGMWIGYVCQVTSHPSSLIVALVLLDWNTQMFPDHNVQCGNFVVDMGSKRTS